MAKAPGSAPCNEIVLVGRLAAPALAKALPSGDELTSFRLVVARGPSPRRLPTGVPWPSVDTFECVAWPAGLQRTARGWQQDDVVEVRGALRRRFWRTGPAVQSRCEVEVHQVKRVQRAG